MSEDEQDFGEGPGNAIGRDTDVGGIGESPGPVPDDDDGADDEDAVRGGPDAAGTQGGAPGDLARPLGEDDER
jgi:hypothetical protein